MSMAAWRAIDWIWRVRGGVGLYPGQSADEVFARIAPLFDTTGTTTRREGDTLTFRKRDPASQDPLSIYGHGVLRVTEGRALTYDMSSRALGFCFVLPALFGAISWLIDGAQISGKVFAGFFVVLYIGGRILEPRLLAGRLARRLADGEAVTA
jgi:hypothetical protein